MNGLFITFEGPDGSGKTTQLKLLADYLSQNGQDVITTREPGGTFISDKIRQILLDPEHKELNDHTEILLYAASRAQHVHEKILPALEKGKIVLCDRYIDASIAYQAYGLGIDKNIVMDINRFASSNLQPQRTYFIEVSPEIGMQRLNKRDQKDFAGLDRIEQKNIVYHERVLEGFRKIAIENSDRILKINGDNAIDGIFETIKKDIDLILKNRKEG